MKNISAFVCFLLSISICCPLVIAQSNTEHSSLVERVGSTGFLQVEAESFNKLTPREQALAYWLTQASIAINPIIFDQQSRFGLRQKHILETIVSHPDDVDANVMERIVAFTKLFWANRGNHNATTAQKFMPTFTYEELETAGLVVIKNGGKLGTPDQFRKELSELKQSLFDPDFEPLTTAKSPSGGKDILQSSSNNYYSGVSLEEMKNFKEKYPLNSRVVKQANGQITEEVYRAGSKALNIPPGRYAEYLEKAITFLTKAIPYADQHQQTVIRDLIRYYQTGDPKDWLKFGGDWVQDNSPVDFANGFIEVYMDARGAKGTSQSFVSITDQQINQLMTKIADNAQYFENKAPWADQYKKLGVKPPLAKAVETVIETGDFQVNTVGDNLPNEEEIHQKYGTKSFLFTGSTRAIDHAAGTSSLREFAYSPEEIALGEKYGDEAENMMTALHEIIGHGSGKVSSKLTKEPTSYLKEYYSTLEEARADLMALWNIFDPKLQELGLVSSPDVGKAMYNAAARAALVQLRSVTHGNTIEEDHQRDRQMIVNYIMDKTGAIEKVERDGKTFLVVRDYDKMRQGVGMLLAELMRIKGEGDYDAIKALVDKYGVHFDTALRDQVVARYNALDLPTYWAGINADLSAKFGANGTITKVEMKYPRDVVSQQLMYSAIYDPGLRPKATTSVRGARPIKTRK